jgi:lipopolysaccharide/colanic/teichoic acid biosynthesis glycosyltransferase
VSLIRLLTKRVLDAAAAAAIAAAAMPAWVAACCITRRHSPGPVLTRAPRAGRFGIVFGQFLFRTGQPAFGTSRTAGILRRLGADKTPSLLNVLRGEMSMVGPAPLPPGEISGSSRLLQAKPGLISWAGTRGRDCDPEERLRLDSWYVNHQSFWVDSWALMIAAARFSRRRRAAAAPGNSAKAPPPQQAA